MVDDKAARQVEIRKGLRRTRVRTAAMVAWGGLAAVAVAVLVIRYGHVMHPGWWWVGIAFAAIFVAAADGLTRLIWTARGRSWQATIGWALLLIMPPVLAVTPLVYGLLAMSAMRRPAAERRLPLAREWGQLSGAMAAALLDAAARVRYPRRTAGEQVVMIYKSAAHAKADVAAMDAHVARISALLGEECTAKAHWVRGRLFGVSRMYFQGLS